MVHNIIMCFVTPGISVGTDPANEGRRHNVMMSLIGWAHTWTDHCYLLISSYAVEVAQLCKDNME